MLVIDFPFSLESYFLNREDIGKRKIASAVKNAKFHNIANTEIVTMDDDALKNW